MSLGDITTKAMRGMTPFVRQTRPTSVRIAQALAAP
jgi:hypothetical protein